MTEISPRPNTASYLVRGEWIVFLADAWHYIAKKKKHPLQPAGIYLTKAVQSMNDNGPSPWICHVCDYKSQTTEGVACSVCYKTTCSLHLKHVSAYNPASGLFELQPVCIFCVGAKLH